ncbi:MAG: UvrD/REP helicase [Rhodospirillaceae bacterium]|nr:MAG: UvrD/REP helicase [Rhodospirillaceae bacterium]
MDSFEPIRVAAEQLHHQVARGTPPKKPLELIDAAIKHLELELAWLPTGDPALKGARAVFDDQSGTIFAEQIGKASQRALVVAHEIGHECIHGGSATCSSEDVDPSRSMEAAPVGLQRVEDYGAHERRELQANVFAREFLFPRSLARRLFVEEGASASDIARQLDLPVPLVRQQILDAILLPPAPTEEEAESPLARPSRPDPAQDRAAAHRGTPFQLQAGPGTGKTKTLVRRILSLLDDGVDPASILVLTFSNRAAGELTERVSAAVPEKAPKIWIGTFHAFGLDLIRRYYEEFKLPADPALFDRSDAIAVLEEILPTLPLVHYRNLWDPALILKEILGAISRAKDELYDDKRYLALAKQMEEDAGEDEEKQVAAQKCLEIAAVYERYERAKADHKAVDFGDLIMGPTRLLEGSEAIRAAVQLRHRHVLVDEYQDVNRASVRLVKAIAGDGKRLWVVGDARQSIYRFRGASSANMAGFQSELFPSADIDQLGISYRSTQQIIDAFMAFAKDMGASKDMLPLKLTADRGAGPDGLDLRKFDRDEDEEEGIAAAIQELERKGVPLRDQAVLCRSNRRLNEIAAALEARNIPVLHLGSLFERGEIRDLLALMSLAVDPFGDALVRVGALPRYGIPLQDVHAALTHLRNERKRSLERLADLATLPGLSNEAADGFRRLSADLQGLALQSQPWDFLTTYLLDRTDIGRSMAGAATIPARMRSVAVWQFLNFLRDHSPVGFGLPIQRALDRVRQLVLLAEERDLRQVPASALHMDAVRLMTVHGSKGLEFEAVHVPGLGTRSFPTSYTGQRCPPPVGLIAGAQGSVSDEAKRSHAMEEECLFFVAMSRARTHLRLYQTRLYPKGGNRSSSKLLTKPLLRLVRETASPPTVPLPPDAPRPQPIEITYGPDWILSDRRLELYQKCPRRFFYTHVLGLGGARKATAFARTHDCLYELIRWMSQARLEGNPAEADAEAAFESIWQDRGPKGHAFTDDYRRLASRLVGALVRSGAGRRFRQSEPLAIDFPNGRVVVEPNERAEMLDGKVVLRRVRTGYRTQREYDGLEYTLYRLAGEVHFKDGFVVEALHLTDGVMEFVELSDEKFDNRRDETQVMLSGINAGDFPTEIDAVTCPRCPHFFICPATPNGSLDLS